MEVETGIRIMSSSRIDEVDGDEENDNETRDENVEEEDSSIPQGDPVEVEADVIEEAINDPDSKVNDEAQTRENIQATSAIFNQMETQAKSCANLIQEWVQKVKSGQVSTDKGLTFLEMKNHTLLNYIISLTGLILNKCSGKSIQGSPYIDQLIESRVILEKIRPIDQKLKYQIDKLVRIAVEGKVESNDPLMYKANLDNLTAGANEPEEVNDIGDVEDTPETKSTKSGGFYRPPKVAPQHYDEEAPKGKSSGDSRKRPAISRNLIRELQEEYLETPVEVHNLGDAYAKRLSREVRDKQRFEESFMTRLPVTKKDKHKERSMSTLGALGDELTDFAGKRARMDGPSKSKKKKMGNKKSKNRGGKKRFRK